MTRLSIQSTQSPLALSLPGHLVSWAMSLLGTRFPDAQSPGHSVATPREVMAHGLAPTVVEAYSHFFAGRMERNQMIILFQGYQGY